MPVVRTKHIFEIRFTPWGDIVDHRGKTARSIAEQSIFKIWEIKNNRINFKVEDDEYISATLSFSNLALDAETPKTDADFIEQADRFLAAAWSMFPTDKITRIGLRTRFLNEVSDLDGALRGYRKNFLKLSDEELKSLGGELVDVGFPLTFKDGEQKIAVNSGPFSKAEAEQAYRNSDDLPEASIFVDVDCFKDEISGEQRQKRIVEFFKNSMIKAAATNQKIVELAQR